jgi:hypothetical protein
VPQATRVYDAWVRLSHAKQQATEKMQYIAFLLPRDVVEIKTLKKTNYTEAYPSYDKLEESQASSCKYDSKNIFVSVLSKEIELFTQQLV